MSSERPGGIYEVKHYIDDNLFLSSTDLCLSVAFADEPRPLPVLPGLVILGSAAATEQGPHDSELYSATSRQF